MAVPEEVMARVMPIGKSRKGLPNTRLSADHVKSLRRSVRVNAEGGDHIAAGHMLIIHYLEELISLTKGK